MSDNSDGPSSMRILQSSTLRWLLISVTIGISVVALIAAATGLFGQASQIAAIASALATILLVSLTAQYAEQTKDLVEETRDSREQQIRENRRDEERELESLRRALHEEIGKVNFEKLSEDYEAGMSAGGLATPNTIYKSNAGKIGLLSDAEIDLIVEYYTRLEVTNEHVEIQRTMDTTVGMDPITEYIARFYAALDWIWVKAPLITQDKTDMEQREENVRLHLRDLVETQKSTLQAIEKELSLDD